MMKRLHQLCVAAFVAAAVVVLPASPAQAITPACAGVTVVVDATALGLGVSVRCAEGAPTSGLDALTKAGFAYTFVPRIPGMVCQIESRPDPCNNAVASAYWSYWHKDPGDAWRYANEGAGTFKPAVGSADGWVFGTGKIPPDATLTAAPEPEQPNRGETPQTNNDTDNPITDMPATNGDTPQSNSDNPASDTAEAPAQNDTTEGDDGTGTVLDRFREDPRQLVGLLLLLVGVGALITARRNKPTKPGN